MNAGMVAVRAGISAATPKWITAAMTVPSSGAAWQLVSVGGGKRAAGEARRAVVAALGVWGVADDDDLVEQARLVASELVGNAEIHGYGPVWMLMVVIPSASGGTLRMDVLDQRPVTMALLRAAVGQDMPSPGDDTAEGGRGLAVVRAVTSHRLLILPMGPFGKAVRAELDLPADWSFTADNSAEVGS